MATASHNVSTAILVPKLCKCSAAHREGSDQFKTNQRERWLLPCSLPAQDWALPSLVEQNVSQQGSRAVKSYLPAPKWVSRCKHCISCHVWHVWFVPAWVQLVYQPGSPAAGAASSHTPYKYSHCLVATLSVSFKSLEVPWECAIHVQKWFHGMFLFVVKFQIIPVVMPLVFALPVMCDASNHVLTPTSHPLAASPDCP